MNKISLDNPTVTAWTKGQEIITSANNKYGELFVVTHSEATGYSFLRCFSLGEDVHVWGGTINVNSGRCTT
jgi:hypothetical protein